MKHIKNIFNNTAALLIVLAALASCNDWLDVQPRSQVEDKELFLTEAGFKEALAGVYSSMVSEATYTRQMLFGAMSVLAQEWDNFPSSEYTDLAQYKYTAATPTGIISGIWSGLYNSIANVNNIINNIDDRKEVFTHNNYSIIKGEALALRAFLHFDLLRCFGMSYAQNADMLAIPYCTELTYRVFPQLTVREVAAKVEADLLAAEALLKIDPIYTGEIVTELDDYGYLINRRVHLNYYAVKGLEARLYMWTHDYAKAQQCASEVTASKVFIWATGNDMMKGYDNSFVHEQLFALNNVNMSTLADTYFNEDNNSRSFSLDAPSLLDYFDSNTSDYRYLYQYISGSRSEYVTYRYLTKYNPSEVASDPYLSQRNEDASFYTDKMPLIRLSEMYLILAECEYRSNGSGLASLNVLRTARNINALATEPVDFYEELIREYRRELIGEGQLFFLYKRLNRATVIGTTVDVIAEKGYTFPLPVSETEAAQRENNR